MTAVQVTRRICRGRTSVIDSHSYTCDAEGRCLWVDGGLNDNVSDRYEEGLTGTKVHLSSGSKFPVMCRARTHHPKAGMITRIEHAYGRGKEGRHDARSPGMSEHIEARLHGSGLQMVSAVYGSTGQGSSTPVQTLRRSGRRLASRGVRY